MQNLINQIDTRLKQGEFKRYPLEADKLIQIRIKLFNNRVVSSKNLDILQSYNFTF